MMFQAKHNSSLKLHPAAVLLSDSKSSLPDAIQSRRENQACRTQKLLLLFSHQVSITGAEAYIKPYENTWAAGPLAPAPVL